MKKAILSILFIATGCSTPISIKKDIPLQDIDQEVQWLSSLGIKQGDKKPVLPNPFKAPFKNRSLTVPTHYYKKSLSLSPHKRIDINDVQKDLELFKLIIERAYGGKIIAEQRGWDWTKFFNHWNQYLIDHQDNLTLEQAFSYFAEYKKFQLDNHTGFLVGKRNLAGSKTAIVISDRLPTKCQALVDGNGRRYPIVETDLGQQPKKRQAFNAQTKVLEDIFYINYPSNKKDIKYILCRGGKLKLQETWQPEKQDGLKERIRHIKALSLKNPQEPSYRPINNKIDYLRLPTFHALNTEKIQKLAPRINDQSQKDKFLIVDLRLNGGGNGESSYPLLKKWLDISSLKKLKLPTFSISSCLARSLRWGYIQVSSQALKPPLSAYQQSILQNSYQEYIEPESCSYSIQTPPSNWSLSMRNHHNLRGKNIMVLTDNYCGSDCEYLVSQLASLNNAVIVGQNTYGVLQYIQPGYGLLPLTGMPYRLANGVSNIYGDNRSVDGHGIDVDILLTNKEDMSDKNIIQLAQYLINHQ